jgi:hypothetical protein
MRSEGAQRGNFLIEGIESVTLITRERYRAVSMLTPMLVQYLVGLCCMRANPSAVEVMVGDMVLDPSAGKQRDVDVTVTLEEIPGEIQGFLAYEVKHESKPLDVAVVEGLCAKLNDMKSLSSRAIVSTSNYTAAARKKAAAHGIELYTLEHWDKPVNEYFPAMEMPSLPSEAFQFGGQILLTWFDQSFYVSASGGPREFTWNFADQVFGANGVAHKTYKNMQALIDTMCLRSTELLLHTSPASVFIRHPEPQNIPSWPMAHTLDLSRERAFLKLGEALAHVQSITISGNLRWVKHSTQAEYYIMKRVTDGLPFAGAMIAGGPPSSLMFALVLAPDSRVINVNTITLLEKHKNAIRKLKLDLPQR